MTHNGEALSRLRGIRLDDLTSAEMKAVLGTTTLTPATSDALEQAAIVSQAMTSQRTYANGNLPIPEQSAIWMEMVAAGETSTIRPTGSEIWEIRAVRAVSTGVGAAEMTTAYEDGALALAIRVGDTIATTGTMVSLNSYANGPIQITNSLYLTFDETGDTNGLMILVAYHKVSQ